MLKRLAMLASLAILAVCVPGQPNKTSDNKEQPASKGQPAVIAAESPSQQPNTEENKPKSDSDPPKWYTALERPDWWLVIVGAIASGLAYGTLRAIAKQAQAQMIAERAWLVIGSGMGNYQPTWGVDSPKFSWRILNAGNTPAQIFETQCKYELVSSVDLYNLPPDPEYPLPIEMSGHLLAPHNEIVYSVPLIEFPNTQPIDLPHETVNAIKEGLAHLRAYGYVKYRDAFGENRESRFCERYVWYGTAEDGAEFRPLIGVPPAYTKCT
jgi:hypothetical protein